MAVDRKTLAMCQLKDRVQRYLRISLTGKVQWRRVERRDLCLREAEAGSSNLPAPTNFPSNFNNLHVVFPTTAVLRA
jgi:hypothetical protein